MDMIKRFSIGDNLDLMIGRARIVLTPSQGLAVAEELARKSFRKALAEEARLPRKAPPSPSPAKRQARG